MNDVYESPLLRNNDYFTSFTFENEFYFITYNRRDSFDLPGFTLCNNQSQRLDKRDYRTELEYGMEILTNKFPEIIFDSKNY